MIPKVMAPFAGEDPRPGTLARGVNMHILFFHVHHAPISGQTRMPLHKSYEHNFFQGSTGPEGRQEVCPSEFQNDELCIVDDIEMGMLHVNVLNGWRPVRPCPRASNLLPRVHSAHHLFTLGTGVDGIWMHGSVAKLTFPADMSRFAQTA